MFVTYEKKCRVWCLMTEGLYFPLWEVFDFKATSVLWQKYIDTGGKERENLLKYIYMLDIYTCLCTYLFIYRYTCFRKIFCHLLSVTYLLFLSTGLHRILHLVCNHTCKFSEISLSTGCCDQTSLWGLTWDKRFLNPQTATLMKSKRRESVKTSHQRTG